MHELKNNPTKTAITIPSLSIVVTVYSETFSITETITRLIDQDRGYIKEIILIVHPNSSQESKEICEQLSKENPLTSVHYQQKTPGVGWALREGMSLSSSDYVALMSSDLETEPEAIDRMMQKIEQTHCDVVIGNRWLKGGGFKNYSGLKFFLNWIFQKIFKTLYMTNLGDLTYGFKILSKDVAKNTPWEGTLHEIFIETTVRPLKNNFKIEQVPTVWIGRKEGLSKNTFLKNFRYITLALKVLFKKKGK